MEQNINAFIHNLIRHHGGPRRIAIDATCGNGHDTVLLAELFDTVYGFDIQPKAIDRTTARLTEHGYDNVRLILDSHALIDRHLNDQPIDLATFNLGYLPHGDKTIITHPDSTVAAVEAVLRRLSSGGLITITLYTGHAGGQAESDALDELVSNLDKHAFTVVLHRYLNRRQAPHAILIERVR